jgi:hypothetical protein
MSCMPSVYKEKDENTNSIMSRSCIVHKVALNNQDAICNGFRGQMTKSWKKK